MDAYYNENDPHAAAWLRKLIAAGHIAPGIVDERSITEVTAKDVEGPGQKHFFGGVAGWSAALRQAGVPDDASIWTGSCPCVSFSSAGRKLGFDDDRHLWPVWFELIRQCRPDIIFAEQVGSPLGLEWLDLVSTQLEGEGYAVAPFDLPASSVGAPHIRQRLYIVAIAGGERREGLRLHVREWRSQSRLLEVGGGRQNLLSPYEDGRHRQAAKPAGHRSNS